ncbi:MAG: dinitrogenase iron-molybdenum cofactor biosynthesis protein [Bacteroidetes bacterium HGW-Bacteroidetes-21]|jgi:predicted Fe-Mo cluster-binding NifX family protein|nr:MAG: dinitrogenase iron-molybdenum cofactor biosynthesis protein [Bacteroidetes bacterium HGW-Bacteroidetes-21]
MKIAIPTRDTQVDDHFGHCAYYTIYEIADNKISDKKMLPSPQGCGCKSNIAGVLKQLNVTIMLAGNMGEGALQMLKSHGIEVIRGCQGECDKVVADYLSGGIKDSGQGCASHDEGHSCGH